MQAKTLYLRSYVSLYLRLRPLQILIGRVIGRVNIVLSFHGIVLMQHYIIVHYTA